MAVPCSTTHGCSSTGGANFPHWCVGECAVGQHLPHHQLTQWLGRSQWCEPVDPAQHLDLHKAEALVRHRRDRVDGLRIDPDDAGVPRPQQIAWSAEQAER